MENILIIDRERKVELPEYFDEFLFSELALSGHNNIDMKRIRKYYPDYTCRTTSAVLDHLRHDGMLELSLGLLEREAMFEKGVDCFLKHFSETETIFFWRSIFSDKNRISKKKRWGFGLDRWKETWHMHQPLIFVPTLFIPRCVCPGEEWPRLVKGYRCINGKDWQYDHYIWDHVNPIYNPEKFPRDSHEPSCSWA
ncbi:MAG: hypothetical protein PHF35_04550 [Candidatus Moranbacteria bacterium]|nr:hypothetical protein [Candidatus Moranbacteria bacterium]